MSEFIQSMTLPFLACLLLAGIHVYLGIHVLARKVIFVDLALAQIAALGAIYGVLLGYDSSSDAWAIKAFSLVFAVVGAAVFSLTRTNHERVPHEAIIGVVYAVALSLAILLSAHLPHGADEFRELLSGSILWVDAQTLIFTALLYSAVGLIHFICRRQFISLSFNKNNNQINVKLWDFWFYVTFAFVVTSSVSIAGVLLVFCYLIIPALVAVLLAEKLSSRLIVGWIVGALVSFAGVLVSYYQDLPSGPTIVVCFAVVLVIVALRRRLLWLVLITAILTALCVVTLKFHEHSVEAVSVEKSAQLTSRDDHERQMAIREIKRLQDKSRIEDLVKAISVETDDYLKIEMAQTLMELGDKRGVTVLTDVMKHGETEQARDEAKTLLHEAEWANYFGPGGPGAAEPRKTVVEAIKILKESGIVPGVAIDIGAGNGRDTIAMLQAGWKVLAIDGSTVGLSQLKERAKDYASMLTTETVFFEDMTLPSAEFINAAYALPFVKKENFNEVWGKIVVALKSGGVFSGQFFGPQDSSASTSSVQSEIEIRQTLLKDFEILFFTERKEWGRNKDGPKFWHVYDVVARKR